MKLYILADRLNKSLDEVFKAIEKLNLNIKSAEQNLTHEEVMEITKYFAEKRRFLFFILLWGYILSFLSAFSFLFKKRGYFYGVCTGVTVFTFVVFHFYLLIINLNNFFFINFLDDIYIIKI